MCFSGLTTFITVAASLMDMLFSDSASNSHIIEIHGMEIQKKDGEEDEEERDHPGLTRVNKNFLIVMLKGKGTISS